MYIETRGGGGKNTVAMYMETSAQTYTCILKQVFKNRSNVHWNKYKIVATYTETSIYCTTRLFNGFTNAALHSCDIHYCVCAYVHASVWQIRLSVYVCACAED